MKKLTKAVAAGLAISMMVPVFAGCKKNRGGEKVSGDDAWFNLNKISLEQVHDSSEFDYANTNYMCTYEDGYVFRLGASRKIPEGTDPETINMNDYYVDELEVYDASGNITNTFDLQSLVNQVSGDYVSVSSVNPTDGGFYADVTSYNYTTQASRTYRSYIDMASGTMSPLTEAQNNGDLVSTLVGQGGSEESSTTLGAYTFRKVWFSESATGTVSSYDIVVTDVDGNVNEIDLRSLYPNQEVFNISNFIDMGDNKVVVLATSSDDDIVFIIDLNTMTATLDNGDWEWLNSKAYMIRQVDGSGSVLRDDDGIYTIDFANKTFVPLFLYTSSNVNAYEIASLTPIYVTADRALFSGTAYNPMPVDSNSTEVKIYEFTKADSNPNAGKTILDIACIGSLNYPLCQAVCEFNGNNADYFLRFDMKYQIEVNNSQGDSSENEDNAATTLGNQLAIDIMSGTGPDLIVNGAQFGMINNDEYLLNLSDFISENCNSDAYYTNIFETSKIAGELFQVPLCFGIQGIVTNASYVDPDQIGFTFEQYQEFVEGPCNGTPPINQGRMYFFLTSLNCMTDLMNEDQIVNYDNEAFRALAEYTAQHVNEVMPSEGDEGYIEEPESYMSIISNVSGYFNATKNGQYAILGLPSYDGRGPIITSSNSVAISAQTIAPDACKEFVSILLGEEIQVLYGYQGGLPVDRSAFETASNKYVESYNNNIDMNLRRFTEAQMILYGMTTEHMDDSATADLSALIDSLSGWCINDGSINAIIREEMPAYFEGQKTLEQIIPVLEDRVQTVINERR